MGFPKRWWPLRRQQTARQAAETAAALHVAHTVPHRINQPLSVILGYAALIEARELPEAKLREYARRMAAASRDIAAITQQFGELEDYEPLRYGQDHGQTVVRLGDESRR
jgi:signal transduction histidine kinase